MDDDGPKWFAPKRYGYGAGLPISWQGWVVTITFVLITIAVATSIGERPYVLIPAILLPAIAFIVIAMKTTRGGWRWRWGEDDD